MEPAASETDGVRRPSTTVAARQYSRMEVHGQGQAQFGDRIYQGGQHIYQYAPVGASHAPAVPTPPFRSLPFPRDTDFVGREDVMNNIKRCLESTGSVALTGEGGIGKSQTALEYCWRFSAAHPNFHIFWISAASTARFDADYRRLAKRLGVWSPCAEADDLRESVKDWLNTHNNWLVVIDNADRYGDFFSLEADSEASPIQAALPWSRPSENMIIYTSRHARVGAKLSDQDCLQLKVMSQSDGIAMFKRKFHASIDDEDILRLLTAVEFLPLNIAHAAAYLKFTGFPVNEYLSRIEGSDKGLLDMLGQSVDTGHQASTSVVKAWKASFDLIQQHNRAAADLLCFIACLERQSIMDELISVITDLRLAELNAVLRREGVGIVLPASEGDRMTATGELHSLALVTRGCEKNCRGYSMHRYVQAITVRHLSEEGKLIPFVILAAKGIEIASRRCLIRYQELRAPCRATGEYPERQHFRIEHMLPSMHRLHDLVRELAPLIRDVDVDCARLKTALNDLSQLMAEVKFSLVHCTAQEYLDSHHVLT